MLDSDHIESLVLQLIVIWADSPDMIDPDYIDFPVLQDIEGYLFSHWSAGITRRKNLKLTGNLPQDPLLEENILTF